MGVSENRGPEYSTLNRRILIIRTPNKVPRIFGNSHIEGSAYVYGVREMDLYGLGFGASIKLSGFSFIRLWVWGFFGSRGLGLRALGFGVSRNVQGIFHSCFPKVLPGSDVSSPGLCSQPRTPETLLPVSSHMLEFPPRQSAQK